MRMKHFKFVFFFYINTENLQPKLLIGLAWIFFLFFLADTQMQTSKKNETFKCKIATLSNSKINLQRM